MVACAIDKTQSDETAIKSNKDPFFGQVQDYFKYLLNEYGFSIAKQERLPHADFADIIFQSASCQIRVMREWGDVFVHVSPVEPKEYWVFLEDVIQNLSQGSKDVRDFRAHIPKEIGYGERIQWQLEVLSTLLRSYIDKVSALCSKGVFIRKIQMEE